MGTGDTSPLGPAFERSDSPLAQAFKSVPRETPSATRAAQQVAAEIKTGVRGPHGGMKYSTRSIPKGAAAESTGPGGPMGSTEIRAAVKLARALGQSDEVTATELSRRGVEKLDAMRALGVK